MDTRESFIVLTGDQGNGSYSLSHVNSVEEVDLLRMKFSGEDSVFDAVPYTGNAYQYAQRQASQKKQYRTEKKSPEKNSRP